MDHRKDSNSVGETNVDYELLRTTLSSFDTRLKLLEAPKNPTLTEKIKSNASFLALLIGVLLSFVSLFDIFWNKPREAVLNDIAGFNEAVNNVASLRQELVKIQFEAKDPQLALAINSLILPQVLANIQYATELLPKLGDHAKIPQLIVLISEAMNIYDWNTAEILVARAENRVDAIPSMRSEALRFKGRLKFVTGKPAEGRIAFQAALDSLKGESAFGINAVLAYISSDWIISEYMVGDCSVGQDKTKQFVELVKHPHIQSQARQSLILNLVKQLNESNLSRTNCPIIPELIMLLPTTRPSETGVLTQGQ